MTYRVRVFTRTELEIDVDAEDELAAQDMARLAATNGAGQVVTQSVEIISAT